MGHDPEPKALVDDRLTYTSLNKLGGIVKRKRLCMVRSSFGEVTCMQQRRTHQAMPHYEWHSRLLLLGE
jgi:hypothetical protein